MTWKHRSVVAAAYLAQGAIHGFAGFVMIPTLAAQGVTLQAQTGLLALAGVPWVLKLVWAPALDVWRARGASGPRRVIIAAMLGVALGLGTLAFRLPTEGVTTLAALWFAIHLVLSLQDVATDAYALDTSSPADRGRLGGVMLGAHHVGAEGIGGLLLGWLVGRGELETAVLALAWGVAMSSVVPLLVRRPTRPGPRPSLRARDLLGPFSRRRRPILALALGVALADVLTSAVSAQLLIVELGWTVDRLARVLPPVVLVCNLLGYGVAWLGVDRWGHARSAALGSAGLGLVWVGFAAVPHGWGRPEVVVATVALQAGATALMYVGLQAWLMDRVEPRARASQFAVYMAAINGPRAVVPWFAPAALATLGWSGLFAVAGGYQLLYGGVVWLSTRSAWSEGAEVSRRDGP